MDTDFAALFVAVKDYDHDANLSDLYAPVIDAQRMRDFYAMHFSDPQNDLRLVKAGTKSNSPTLNDLQTAISALQMRGRTGAALFYFSGHGVEIDGRPYLAMSDARIDDRGLTGAISLDELVAKFDFAETVALIVDACRLPPAGLISPGNKGFHVKALSASALESVPWKTAHHNVAILFCCASGKGSSETKDGGNFTSALLEILRELVATRERVIGEDLRNRVDTKLHEMWPLTPQSPQYYYSGSRIAFVPRPHAHWYFGDIWNRSKRFALTPIVLLLLALITRSAWHYFSAPTVEFVHSEADRSIRQFQRARIRMSTGTDYYNSYTDEMLKSFHEQGTANGLGHQFLQDDAGLLRELKCLSPSGREEALSGLDHVARPTFAEVGNIRNDGSAQTEAGQQAERELAQEIVNQLREATSGQLPRLFWWLYTP